MRRSVGVLALIAAALLSSCAKKESAEAQEPAADAPAGTQAAGSPYASVILKDRSKVPGAIVAGSQTDMAVAGDDGIERKIPLTQIKSVEYLDGQPPESARPASREPAPQKRVAKEERATARQQSPLQTAGQSAPPPAPAVTARMYELPSGSEISVRTNELIDSGTAAEGRSFDAQVTRDTGDASGAVVIPRGAGAGAGALTQVLTKGGAIKVPAESVLTFSLDKPLRVAAAE